MTTVWSALWQRSWCRSTARCHRYTQRRFSLLKGRRTEGWAFSLLFPLLPYFYWGKFYRSLASLPSLNQRCCWCCYHLNIGICTYVEVLEFGHVESVDSLHWLYFIPHKNICLRLGNLISIIVRRIVADWFWYKLRLFYLTGVPLPTPWTPWWVDKLPSSCECSIVHHLK